MIRAHLLGPFLTRVDAAQRSGLSVADLPYRPDLLRIGGRFLPEVYFQFQFGPQGIRNEIGTVVLAMRGAFDDITIADWLARPNAALRGESPLERLLRTHRTSDALGALRTAAPESPDEAQDIAEPDPAAVRARLVSPHRRMRLRVRRGLAGRPAATH